MSCCIGIPCPRELGGIVNKSSRSQESSATDVQSSVISKSVLPLLRLYLVCLILCLSTILPKYVFESFEISHFDGLHFNSAPFIHETLRPIARCETRGLMTLSPHRLRNTLPSFHTSLLLLLGLVISVS